MIPCLLIPSGGLSVRCLGHIRCFRGDSQGHPEQACHSPTPTTPSPSICSFLALRRYLYHPPLYLISSSSQHCSRIFRTGHRSQPPRSCTHLPLHPRHNFPRHCPLPSDCLLPDTITGANTPVARTRYRGAAVPCKTLFVVSARSSSMAPILLWSRCYSR